MSNTTLSGEDVVRLLDNQYPNIKTPLNHEDAFQLLIATILSAQCTDAQVNRVTPVLFAKFPDPRRMAIANLRQLQNLIKPTGFFHVKARRIRDVSKKIQEDYKGRVPHTMEDLLTLPGVGRKTANIVLSAGLNKISGVAVDTHVQRLSKRIGLSDEKTPEKIEQDLMAITPKVMWSRLSLLLILHGRRICMARKPLCERCVLSSRCRYYREKKASS